MNSRTALAVAFVLLCSCGWGRCEAPITMADPDGHELAFKRLDVRVAAHGPLSLTELEMVFVNPTERTIEGRFSCVLPAGAALSRLAKEINGELMEGEVVERLYATQVYESFFHPQPRDPVLLQQDQGNRYSVRVFPIEPRGTVRMILSYSRVIPLSGDGVRRVEVPLKGLPRLGGFRLRAVCRPLPGEEVAVNESWLGLPRSSQGEAVIFSEERDRESFVPPEDFALVVKPAPAAAPATIVSAGDYLMLAVRPAVPAPVAAPDSTAFVVAVDTSASQAAFGQHRAKALAAVLRGLASARPGASFELCRFDRQPQPFTVPVVGAEAAESALTALLERPCLGATDLAGALAALGAKARGSAEPRTFILATDGVPTWGPRNAAALVRALGDWPARHVLHVLVVGSTQDEVVTSALAAAGAGRVVVVPLSTAWSDAVEEAIRSLLRPLGAAVRLVDPSAEWIEPARFRDVRPGQELVAFAKVKPGATSVPAVIVDGATPRPLATQALSVPTFASLLEREAVRSHLAFLEGSVGAAKDDAERTAIRRRMIDLSTRYRVVCPLTTLLVLETERDYERFGITRRSRDNILGVGAEGIEQVDPTTASYSSQSEGLTWLVRGLGTAEPRITITAKAADVRGLLQRIARVTRANVVFDQDVRGAIAIELKDVTPLEALRLVTKGNGLALYEFEGLKNTFAVTRYHRIQEFFEAGNAKVFTLRDQRAADARTMLQSRLPPGSPVSIEVDERTNSLIMTGTEQTLAKAGELLRERSAPAQGLGFTAFAQVGLINAATPAAPDPRSRASMELDDVALLRASNYWKSSIGSPQDAPFGAPFTELAAEPGPFAEPQLAPRPAPTPLISPLGQNWDPPTSPFVLSLDDTILRRVEALVGEADEVASGFASLARELSALVVRCESPEAVAPELVQEVERFPGSVGPLDVRAARLARGLASLGGTPPPPLPGIAAAAEGAPLARRMIRWRQLARGNKEDRTRLGGELQAELARLDHAVAAHAAYVHEVKVALQGVPETRLRKATPPAWTREAERRPTAAALAALRQGVRSQALDRRARQALCAGLGALGRNDELLEQAVEWQHFDPFNPEVYEIMGATYGRLGRPEESLRAYLSLPDLSPGDAALASRTGYLVLREGHPDLAAALFRTAIERRPDNANHYRGLALALWTEGRYGEAGHVLEAGIGRPYGTRQGLARWVLREELGYVLRAWLRAEPAKRRSIEDLAARTKVDLNRTDALRLTLHWDADAGSVDLCIADPWGATAKRFAPVVASGLQLRSFGGAGAGRGPLVAIVPPGFLLRGRYHVGVRFEVDDPTGVTRGVVTVMQPNEGAAPHVKILPFSLSAQDASAPGRVLYLGAVDAGSGKIR